MYKIGDKIQVKDGRWGTVVEIESDNTLGEDFLKIDVGTGYVWTWSHKLPQQQTNCTCGVKFVRDGGLHSDWCEVKNTTNNGGSNESVFMSSSGFSYWPGW